MLGILAKSFMTATRSEPAPTRNHWGEAQRFDTRKDAEIAAQTATRSRD